MKMQRLSRSASLVQNKPFGLLFTFALVAATCASAAEDPPDLRGRAISAVRSRLFQEGWAPVETAARFADGTLERDFGDAGRLRKDGIIEVETCSGSGRNVCVFNYRHHSNCLRLTTQGERDPIVLSQSKRCPDPKSVKSIDAIGH